jgi:hypothetical protein
MKCSKNSQKTIHKNVAAAFLIILCWYISLFGFSDYYSALAETSIATTSLQAAKTLAPKLVSCPTGNKTFLIGVGDSLTQGTMDDTINTTTTSNAYLQKVADSLSQVIPLTFTQPFLNNDETRLMPFRIPTNLGVDGSDIFSVEGIEYYKRVGTRISYVTPHYLCKRILPWRLQSDYDKVLYPIDLLSHHPISQIGSAIWLLNHCQSPSGKDRAIVIFWMGNNDSSIAALGLGGANPMFLPIPLDQIDPEISPELSFLLHFAQNHGSVSFSPYTLDNIERNLTTLHDFTAQYEHLLNRLKTEGLRS